MNFANSDLKSDFVLNEYNLINFINMSEQESELVRSWRNDLRIKDVMVNNHIISEQEHLDFIEGLRCKNNTYHWLVRRHKEYLGVVNLLKKENDFYLGIYKNPDTPPGTGVQLLECLNHLVFDIQKTEVLKLEVLEFNHAARNFYRKHGFIEVGKIKKHVHRDGKWFDSLIMKTERVC